MKDLIKEWHDIKMQLTELQGHERTLRVKIAEAVLDGKKEGSKTEEIEGYKVTATGVLSYNIDKDELAIIEDDLNDEERECLRYKPELILKDYRALRGSQLAKVVTVREGIPQLKVKI